MVVLNNAYPNLQLLWSRRGFVRFYDLRVILNNTRVFFKIKRQMRKLILIGCAGIQNVLAQNTTETLG